MSMTISRVGTVVTAVLSGELRVQHVNALKTQLLPALDLETSLVLAPSGVTRVDTSVLQLLFFAARLVRDVRVDAPSSAWSSAWTLIGLALPSPAALDSIVHSPSAVTAVTSDQ